MSIAIVDYGRGNLHSVSKAVERLGYEAVVTGDAQVIRSSSGVILPGVGAFGDAMEHLRSSGLDRVIQEVASAGQPLLGVCLGMQLMFTRGEEYGSHEGLNILPGEVVRFAPDLGVKVPHMGWNRLRMTQPNHPLLQDLEEGHVYFVHSYHAKPEAESDLLAVTDYGGRNGYRGRSMYMACSSTRRKAGKWGCGCFDSFWNWRKRKSERNDSCVYS